MKTFNPGFRISKSDIVILIFGLIGSILLYKLYFYLSCIIIFVVLHFFVFCNIVRMSRIAELLWSAVFLGLSISSIKLNYPTIETSFIISLALTSLLILIETKKPSYHGILWARLNPNLPNWYKEHVR